MTILTGIDFKTFFFTDSDRASFYFVMQDFAKEFGCVYLSYLFEDKNKQVRVGFGSNPDWQAEFVKNQLMNECHICKQGIHRSVTTKRNFLIFPWETVRPSSSREKDIVLYRSECGIGENGISFVTVKNNKMEAIALAPENNNPNFIKYVSKNIHLIKNHINIFRAATNGLVNI